MSNAVEEVVDAYTYGLSRVAQLTGLSERFLAKLIARGDVPSIKIGRRRLVLAKELKAFLDRRAGNQSPTENI